MRKLFRLGLRATVLAAIVGMLFLAATPSMAALNKGTGSIAGVPADLTDSADFELNTTTLGLVKRAFLADGTVIPDGANLPKGTTVKFIIYVNNDTVLPITDVSIQDDLVEASFVYTANSIKVDNTATCAALVCTPAEENAIYTAIDDNVALTDTAAGGDVASFNATGAIIDVGNDVEAANDQLDILANRVFAVQLTVTMQ